MTAEAAGAVTTRDGTSDSRIFVFGGFAAAVTAFVVGALLNFDSGSLVATSLGFDAIALAVFVEAIAIGTLFEIVAAVLAIELEIDPSLFALDTTAGGSLVTVIVIAANSRFS